MTVTLSMLRCPDAVPPQTRTVAGGEFSIGRGAENDWVLPDPDRVLSKNHCLLAYRSGRWQLADLSTNGTFLNGEAKPIGRGQTREVCDGDRMRLGSYEVELRIAESATPRAPSAGRKDPFAPDPFVPGALLAVGPLDQDPLLRAGPQQDAIGDPLEPPSINLPRDYDPLAPEPGAAPFSGPVQADHSPHIGDAFRPGAMRALLPDDWDREPDSQPPSSVPRIPEPPPPQNLTELPPSSVPATPNVPPPQATVPGTVHAELLAAFLRGIGLPNAQPADPLAAMESLGAAFRALVSGLRLALIARAAIKGEFRIEQTMIRRRGNNPLKFAADDDDALIALLGAGRRTEMGAAEAVSEALRDMRLHEVATVAAMRAAVQGLLARLEPIKLRLAAEHGGLNLVSVQTKARAWDAFEALYAQTSQALNDDFDSVFGKAFARAYERALGEASAKELPT